MARLEKLSALSAYSKSRLVRRAIDCYFETRAAYFPSGIPENFMKGVSNADLQEKKQACVYLIKADNGLFKIGCTKNLDGRLDNFMVTLPYETELITTIRGKKYRETERYLHNKFQSKHVRGEWYDLDQADVEFMKNLETTNQIKEV